MRDRSPFPKEPGVSGVFSDKISMRPGKKTSLPSLRLSRAEKNAPTRDYRFFFKKYRFGDLTHAKRCPYRNELITSTCNLRVVSWCDTFDFIPLMFPLSEISVWSRIVFIIREKYSSHTKSNKAASNNACLKHFYFLRLSFQTILRFTVMS